MVVNDCRVAEMLTSPAVFNARFWCPLLSPKGQMAKKSCRKVDLRRTFVRKRIGPVDVERKKNASSGIVNAQLKDGKEGVVGR
jgi:hypothetical protein